MIQLSENSQPLAPVLASMLLKQVNPQISQFFCTIPEMRTHRPYNSSNDCSLLWLDAVLDFHFACDHLDLSVSGTNIDKKTVPQRRD